MKNIKIMMLLTVCLAASTLLKAQQAKQAEPQPGKEIELKQLPPADVNKIPAPQSKSPEQAPGMKVDKPVLLQAPANPNSSLTPEQAKTANGTSQKPVMVIAPGTEQKPVKSKPVVTTAPVEQ